MNAFEHHGINRLSPSSLNLWAAEPALWVMERLLKHRSPTSASAARGKAVEAGVNIGLFDPSMDVDACIAKAESEFDRETRGCADARCDDERGKLAGYVRGALPELRKYGKPDADGYQGRVETTMDGVPVPVVGFVDWRYSDKGLIVDLKTSERFPSSIKPGQLRQGALYATANGNFGMRFVYVKPSQSKGDGRQAQMLEMSGDEIRTNLEALRLIALSLGRFLATSRDAKELAGMITPNYDSFYWSDPSVRAAGREVYGF